MKNKRGEKMTQKNIGNRKALRSRKKISRALIDLMAELPYSEITISKLTEHAGLSRRTFYRNYTSKDDIINEHYYLIWEDYTRALKKEKDMSLKNVALVFFNTMQKHQELLNLFNQNNLLNLFLNQVSHLMIEDYSTRPASSHQLDTKSLTYITLFVSGGFFQMAKAWFDSGQKESPEELAGCLENLTKIYSD